MNSDSDRARLARAILAASGRVLNPDRYLAGLMRLRVEALQDRLNTITSQNGIPFRRNQRLNLATATL